MPSTSSPSQTLDIEGLIEFTCRLVRVKSVNRPDEGLGEAEAVEVVRQQAETFGWDVLIEEVEPGRPNVIVEIDGGMPGKTLLFEGHTDVVTEGDIKDWSFDPFCGDLVDGKICGRGAADMKGGVAAMMFATKAIQESGPFPGKIKLGILCDEEEMMIGVHDFIRRGHADGVDGAIVCEPEAGEICTVQKGAIRLQVDVFGVMAHGAMPHQGKNPVSAAALLIAVLASLEKGLQSTHGEHEHLGLPYVTPTHFAAGSLPQLNVIPSQALLTLDIRTIPGIDHEYLLKTIRGLADGVSEETGVEFEFTVLVDRPPTETPLDDPIVRAVVEAHEAVTGNPAVFGGVPGTTDGTILWRDAGLPIVVYGPGGKWIAHQHDEYVEVDDLVSHARVYVDAARRFLAS
ncbi:MAG: M20 family metallopeptidase [Actinomycetota bacterium]|nr:M20 family metallopeptidase [Actinomycetota bacterium]